LLHLLSSLPYFYFEIQGFFITSFGLLSLLIVALFEYC